MLQSCSNSNKGVGFSYSGSSQELGMSPWWGSGSSQMCGHLASAPAGKAAWGAQQGEPLTLKAGERYTWVLGRDVRTDKREPGFGGGGWGGGNLGWALIVSCLNTLLISICSFPTFALPRVCEVNHAKPKVDHSCLKPSSNNTSIKGWCWDIILSSESRNV